jgi:hypothetical protein
MLVESHQVVAWLTRTGDLETAFEVEGVLPPHLDTDKDDHRALLREHGVDVDRMLTELAPEAP